MHGVGDIGIFNREGHEGTRREKQKRNGSRTGKDDAFPLEAAGGTEVHEKTKLKAGDFEVVQHLDAVLVSERSDGFEFDDDLIVTE
jgi:hypothetical protein